MQFKNSDNDSKLILSTHSALLYIVLSLLEFEVSGEDVIHEVVKVGSINQPLALIAWVHGSPTELVIDHLTFHEAPHRATHHRHWFLARQDQDLTHCINLNSLPEELTYMGLKRKCSICWRNTCRKQEVRCARGKLNKF